MVRAANPVFLAFVLTLGVGLAVRRSGLGALTVPPCLAAAVAGLWVGLRLWGA